MTKKLPMAAVVACCEFFVASGQQAATPALFTAAQAAAGRTADESTCGKCHTRTLMGRKGAPGELPPVSSLPAAMQDVVNAAGGIVPPLAGEDFWRSGGRGRRRICPAASK